MGDKISPLFKVGDVAESRSLDKGFRGAWFRCKIKDVAKRKGRVEYLLEYYDFPDEGEEWIEEHKMLHPRRGKRMLMLRPRYPPIYKENQMPDAGDISEVGVVVNDGWKVGNLVDLLYSGCYWSGRILKLLGDDKAQVKLFPPPLGEGGEPYNGDIKDLRPSLNWYPELGWMMPKEDPFQGGDTNPPCAWLIKPMNQVQENEDGHELVCNANKEAEVVQLTTPAVQETEDSRVTVSEAITEAESVQCKTLNAVQEIECDQRTTSNAFQGNEGGHETSPSAVHETEGGSRISLNPVKKTEVGHWTLPSAVQGTGGGCIISPNAVVETEGGHRTSPKAAKKTEGGRETLSNAVQETEDGHKTTPTALQEIESGHGTTRSSVGLSHSSPASFKSVAAPNDQKSTGTMENPKQSLRCTVSEEVKHTQEESLSMEHGNSSTRKRSLRDATDSGQNSSAPMAEVAEEDLNSSSPMKKYSASEGLSVCSMHSGTMEAAVLDLEECLNRIKWLKAILRDGVPSSESARPRWEFVAASPIPK